MSSKSRLLALAAAGALIAAGCSSSTKPSSSSTPTTGAATQSSTGSPGSGKTYTIGVLTDLTGLAAGNELTVPDGIKAGVYQAAKDGYKIKFVVADAQTSPTDALSAAQKLVEQDHVFAVIAISSVAFGATDYLASKGIPVIGAAVDGNEWTTEKNMFAADGTEDFTKVYTSLGQFFKQEGVTNTGIIGYNISPSSQETAKADAISAQLQGIKSGYLNVDFPFGGTNVGPEVIAMKQAGVNGYTGTVETNTNFAIITALRQDGVNVKAALLDIGYGGDLQSGGPGAEQAAQGVFFTDAFEPNEMNTPATRQFANDMKAAAGVDSDPSLNEQYAYGSVAAFVAGLQKSGPNPTQADFINTMLGTSSFNAWGLLGDHPVGFTMAQRGQANGNEQCSYIVKYQGSTFHLVQGDEPLCGTLVPGKTVSSS